MKKLDVVLVTWPNHPERMGYFRENALCLRDNLTATGYDIVLKASAETQRDPDCPWHGDELEAFCRDQSIQLHWRTDCKAGLGENMNHAMSLASSDVFLLVQDDWILDRPLDLGPGADFLTGRPDVAMIRYSWPGDLPTFLDMPDGWRRLDLEGRWPYGDDPSLRRRDFMERYGGYAENVPHGTSEGRMLRSLVAAGADIRANAVCCFRHAGRVPAVPERDDPRGYEPRRLASLADAGGG